MKNKLLGEILIENGACSAADISRALEIQKDFGGKIGTILINTGNITEPQMLQSLAEQLDLEYRAETDEAPIKTGLRWPLLIKKRVIPFRQDDNSIYVMTNNPLQAEAFYLLEEASGKKCVPVLTREENINRLIAMIDESEAGEDDEIQIFDDEVDKLKELASEAPVIKSVNAIFGKAMDMNASDIHFESEKHSLRVRLRIDGNLTLIDTIPYTHKLAVISRLKLLSGMNIAENRLPQDGRISLKIASKNIDIRASSIPTQHGESFVLRLLGKENISYSIESLGFYNDHQKLIMELGSKANGIFLTTGPTGSGKTTTLYSVLSGITSEEIKIITVEDPIEYELSGINQIQVKPDIGYSFAKALRSILRQDPDVIMVGEIRDRETAEIAIQASLTGHLVLSTLHTNSALASITRLVDMGIEYYLLKASVIGLMAQRLVRRLCPHCAEPDTFSPEMTQKMNISRLAEKYGITVTPMKPAGCLKCGNTGFSGRIVIAEVLPFNRDIQAFFEKDTSFSDITMTGYRGILEDGLLKCCEGKTHISEVLRAIQ
jgi:type II secretory ATPase GspE/PulE/Tfp pilus assembly ATPase PilB-like protein